MNMIFKNKNTLKNNKRIVLLPILFSMVIVFTVGMLYALAYYDKHATFPFLSSTVGDFEGGDGDINVMIYIQKDSLDGYNLIKSIPLYGYIINDTLTDCDADYTIVGNTINISSSGKKTCKFYYDKLDDTDVKVLTMVEDDEGNYTYNNKKYKLSDFIPSYGFEYTNYNCLDSSKVTNVTYVAETRSFSVSTTGRNACYTYFNKLGVSDVTVNVYIREDLSTNRYVEVEHIPSLKTYKLSTDTQSYCQNKDGTKVNNAINYTNGQIVVTATKPEACYVYLDIVN